MVEITAVDGKETYSADNSPKKKEKKKKERKKEKKIPIGVDLPAFRVVPSAS